MKKETGHDSPISGKWVFRINNKESEKHNVTKLGLVALGFTEKNKVTPDETYASVAKMLTIIILFSTVNNFKLK